MGNGLVAAEVKPLQSAADDPVAKATAGALKQYLTWIYTHLEGHPLNKARVARGEEPLTNAFVTHLADQLRPVMPFKQRWGLKGLSISSKLVQAGLSAVLGMDRVKVKSNRDPAIDLSERISIAAENLAAYDFVGLPPWPLTRRPTPTACKEESYRGAGSCRGRIPPDAFEAS